MAETAEERIENCPFCGHEAEYVQFTGGENDGGEAVCCTRCLASGPIRFPIKDSTDVIDHWNHRAAVEAERERWSIGLVDDPKIVRRMIEDRERARCADINPWSVECPSCAAEINIGCEEDVKVHQLRWQAAIRQSPKSSEVSDG